MSINRQIEFKSANRSEHKVYIHTKKLQKRKRRMEVRRRWNFNLNGFMREQLQFCFCNPEEKVTNLKVTCDMVEMNSYCEMRNVLDKVFKDFGMKYFDALYDDFSGNDEKQCMVLMNELRNNFRKTIVNFHRYIPCTICPNCDQDAWKCRCEDLDNYTNLDSGYNEYNIEFFRSSKKYQSETDLINVSTVEQKYLHADRNESSSFPSLKKSILFDGTDTDPLTD